MEIRSRIFEKYTDYNISIPIRDGDKVLTKKGKVKVGDTLLERSESSLKKSLNVPKVFNCKGEDSEKYLIRMDGEYIEEGEVLAQRVSSGGLTVTEIFSPVSGVIDLSRIKHGYIDILGEERSTILKSDFNGEVEGVDPVNGLTIKTDAVCVDGVVSSKSDVKLLGQLEILGDGNTILTEKALDDDYRGKIVWVGPYLYNRVAVELFERGAVAVLTYAMSYTDFRTVGLPIMILGGFGSVHCDSNFLRRFISFKNRYVMVDGEESQLYILTSSEIKNRGWFVNQYENQSVISRSPSTYGYIGRVIERNLDSDFVLVDFGSKGSSLINIGLLDFIDL